MLSSDRLFVALESTAAEAGGYSVPDWVQLIPAQPDGRDGRSWRLDDPASVVQTSHRPLPVDWDHALELRAPQGLEAPAAGWIDELKVDAASVWGRIEWTPRARTQIASREYRYLSPVILYEPESRRIRKITSVALTNTPNFVLPALNHEEHSMSLPIAICAALEVPAEATEQQALDRIAALKSDLVAATNRADTPPLEKFVPRAEYDAALLRATNAEQALSVERQTKLNADITAAIESALLAGKITPATREFFTGLCRREGGLAEFNSFLAAAPVILPTASVPTGKPPKGISPQQELISRNMGIDPTVFTTTEAA